MEKNTITTLGAILYWIYEILNILAGLLHVVILVGTAFLAGFFNKDEEYFSISDLFGKLLFYGIGLPFIWFIISTFLIFMHKIDPMSSLYTYSAIFELFVRAAWNFIFAFFSYFVGVILGMVAGK